MWLQSPSDCCAKWHENGGGRIKESNKGDERNTAVMCGWFNPLELQFQLQISYKEQHRQMEHSLGASSAHYLFLFFYFFFQISPSVSFAHSIPPYFPNCPPLWVTDTWGKMCVCYSEQAGCYCHQEQSHLLPNTRCTMNHKMGQKKIY